MPRQWRCRGRGGVGWTGRVGGGYSVAWEGLCAACVDGIRRESRRLVAAQASSIVNTQKVPTAEAAVEWRRGSVVGGMGARSDSR